MAGDSYYINKTSQPIIGEKEKEIEVQMTEIFGSLEQYMCPLLN